MLGSTVSVSPHPGGRMWAGTQPLAPNSWFLPGRPRRRFHTAQQASGVAARVPRSDGLGNGQLLRTAILNDLYGDRPLSLVVSPLGGTPSVRLRSVSDPRGHGPHRQAIYTELCKARCAPVPCPPDNTLPHTHLFTPHERADHLPGRVRWATT